MTKTQRKALEEEYLLLLEKTKRDAQKNFWKFCLYMDYDFYKVRSEILKPIARDMQRLVAPEPPETELDILNVSVPPRTGKSYLCTLFVVWCIGKWPEESIMRNTVTGKLYKKFSKDARDIIQGVTHQARYKEIFDIKLLTEAAEGWTVEGSRANMTYFGAGTEGNIIGFGASLLSILDDSIKDAFVATNDYQLEKIWNWYTSAADSREESKCKKLFIGTRWSKNDVVGQLQKAGFFKGDRAKYIAIPALANGKSYCEQIHTTESLIRKKKITSSFIWAAEWQQNPTELGSLLFPAESLNWFEGPLKGEPDAVRCHVDVADSGTDYLSAPIGKTYIKADKTYIDDVVFTTDTVENTIPVMAAKIIEHKVNMANVEANNGGRSYRIMLKDKVKQIDPKNQTTFIDKQETKNKETRILMKSGYIKENFWFRRDYEEGSEYGDFIENLITYSKSGKNSHDDAPDSLNGLAELMTAKKKEVRII